VFREEIRNEISSARRQKQRGRKLWEVLNSSLVIWFLTSIVVAAISWKISDAALNRERRETLRRLKWEVSNNGVEFEYAVKRAWNRFEYEAAFSDKLQNPKARLVDLKPFTLDRITFKMEHLGASADRNAAAAARRATLGVWKLIESKLGNLDWYALSRRKGGSSALVQVFMIGILRFLKIQATTRLRLAIRLRSFARSHPAQSSASIATACALNHSLNLSGYRT